MTSLLASTAMAVRSLRTKDVNKIHIGSAFDSGNIIVISADDPQNIQLQIKPDPDCKKDGRAHFQWFHFQVSGDQQVYMY